MDARVQRSVIANLSLRPNAIEVGPFVIGWDPTTDSRFVNYATPQLDAVVTPADVTTLVAAFRDIDRVPRLEYVTSCAPGLEQQLIDAGFTVEARHDYLVCSPDSLTVPATPDGFEVAEPATDAQRAGLVAVQNEAFGEEPVATPADIARVRRVQDNGGVVMLVRNGDGVCVAGGQATPPSAGVSEVAGIAVRKECRRRGIAGALTAAITARLFATGVEVAWLEASGTDSWRVYERVGYVPTGKRLYIALD
ncbi:Acetyltransferase (GNAT) domain-containing protein [Micromonospora rhizosphaerae]|uniref:Acetyltransferase (GNAT) domain-containing protein n=1 Tax=Micromonospora rhizosphaerae TaxID=568872 RepID=A0A1C6RTN8_9ACTN|nr:GNAT family N-acetyltransferase [Micromonospora rhizosphaerae]SCL20405.1 Acetyltransferase (GNAT) domain-containing protein [Micromonospora rhizosphaerae]